MNRTRLVNSLTEIARQLGEESWNQKHIQDELSIAKRQIHELKGTIMTVSSSKKRKDSPERQLEAKVAEARLDELRAHVREVGKWEHDLLEMSKQQALRTRRIEGRLQTAKDELLKLITLAKPTARPKV